MKRYLLTPGPTPVPEDIALLMAKPMIHHRTSEFKNIFAETVQLAKSIFQTRNDVVIFASSGSGAMEAAVSNVLNENEKAITINAGKFGERWTKLVRAFGANPIELSYEYGDYAKPEDIKKVLDNNGDVKAVYIQASETSTATYHPIDEIGLMLKEYYPDVLFVVDGITAYGAIDVKTDDWGIDIAITGSQKALMLPPGLSLLAISDKAKDKIKNTKNRYYYFDILGEIDAGAGKFTPAVSLVIGLNGAFKRLLDEGLENVFRRHALLSKATQEACKALGLELLSRRPANSLTAAYAPQNIDSSKIIGIMRDYGVEISNGQGHLKGKIFRIAHLGYFDKADILMGISTLEIALRKLGVNAAFGEGIKRAMEIFADE
ncbi:pyridoxal-phosphate-dependent aminotransferase family protein [Hippea maritima]|uniref:Serine--glyoxylate transaminase n=1 Tax=Hippea maritima (strain ATCC 700847 / DSM 10411 / MH2) TaxID=760142 RepID=F2LUM7_HIPMA|nr:alanine--glyoxylate aminotransferase family protein [Hippea maritima]AEA34617.1 Serine--glyoxylate transaminase [Hippea maritima DSM 10411]